MPSPPDQKTVHSALFFACLLLALAAILALLWLAVSSWIPQMGGFAALAEKNPGAFYCVLSALVILVFWPLVYLLIWAMPRLSVRIDRILTGEGWGGWVYRPEPPAASTTVQAARSRQQAMLRKKRLDLCWQLPLILIASTIWAVLVEVEGWWGLNHHQVLHFLLAGLVEALLVITLPAWLIARAYPKIKRTAQEYMAHKYPGLVARGEIDFRQGHSPDLVAVDEEDACHRTGPAHRRKHLWINLVWQTPLLLALAALFTEMGFAGSVLTPLEIVQGREMVEISATDPLMFFVGGVVCPLVLLSAWVHAWPNAARLQHRLRNLPVFGIKMLIAVLIGCFALLLPGQFLLMPALDYRQCTHLEFLQRGSAIPIPSPVKWVKPEQADRESCPYLRRH